MLPADRDHHDMSIAPPEAAPETGEPDSGHYRRQLETIAQNATLALFIMDERQQCTYMNPAAERLTGYTLAEVKGKALHDYVHHTRPDGTRYPLEECPIDRAFPQNMREQGEEVFVHKDGHFYPVAFTASPIRDGDRTVGTIIEARDITSEKIAEADRQTRAREGALAIAVGSALTRGGSLREVLQRCAEAVVEHLDAAFARIWTLNEAESMLELQASAGLYTHLDGPHGRVPVGSYKIGKIAEEKRPHLTNDVLHDPRVSDKAWAEREGMVAFAGYPLLVEERVVGVLALFARRNLPERTLAALGAIADGLALAVDRDRVQAAREELLHEVQVERSRLSTVFQESPAFIAMVRGPDHVFEMANPPYYQLVAHREIVGKPVREALPEVVEQGFVDLLDSVYRTGEPFVGSEVKVLLQRHPDAAWEENYLNFVYQPLTGADGSVTGILVHGVDVTEMVEARRRTQEQAVELEMQKEELEAQASQMEEIQVELEMSNEELRRINEEIAGERAQIAAVIEYAPVGIVIADAPSGRILTGNRRVEEILRHPVLPSESVDAYGEWIAFHPDGRRVEAHEFPLARVFATGAQAGPSDYRYQRGDGTLAWVQITGAPIHDAKGELTAGLVVIDDIDVEKRAEQEREQLIRELELERSRLRELFMQAPAMIAVLRGSEHRFELANPPYLATMGMRDIVGKTIREALPELEGQGYFEMLDGVYTSGREVLGNESVVLFDRRGDGVLEEGFFNFVFQPLRDTRGAVDGILIHAVDVTEQVLSRRDAEAKAEELARLARKLEVSNRDLDQFAYAASHDLKAPLRGISNLATWVEEDLGDRVTEDARGHLELLRNRVHRMEGLIDGILQYSRAGRVREEVEIVDVGTLLSEVVELIAPPEGVEIRIGEAMPRLLTERLPLQQVFMNLIGNALKYNRSERPWVRVEAAELGDEYQFSVADNGPGIPEAYQERIFGIFQTLEPRDKVEGTGIGLSLVKRLVESRGGRVWVESTEGAGATFRFTWPTEMHDVAGS
jgi:PAS domain S-box-containing protein